MFYSSHSDFLLGCLLLMKFLKTFASSRSHFASQSLLCSSITREKTSSHSWKFSVTENIIHGTMEESKKKNYQPNTNFVWTVFSQNVARHLLKKTIPHILQFIYKTASSLDCCPDRVLKKCSENTYLPWKTPENLKRKQVNNPNTLLLHLLIKTSNYSDQNLFASNKKGIQIQSFSTLCSLSLLQVLSPLIYRQCPAAVHAQQAPSLLPRRRLPWNTAYSRRHYRNLI